MGTDIEAMKDKLVSCGYNRDKLNAMTDSVLTLVYMYAFEGEDI